MAAYIAGALATLAGLILLVGLVRIARLMYRVAGSLASVRLLSAAIAHSTQQVGEFVADIGENLRGLEEVSEGITRDLDTRQARTHDTVPFEPSSASTVTLDTEH